MHGRWTALTVATILGNKIPTDVTILFNKLLRVLTILGFKLLTVIEFKHARSANLY